MLEALQNTLQVDKGEATGEGARLAGKGSCRAIVTQPPGVLFIFPPQTFYEACFEANAAVFYWALRVPLGLWFAAWLIFQCRFFICIRPHVVSCGKCRSPGPRGETPPPPKPPMEMIALGHLAPSGSDLCKFAAGYL